MAVVVHLNDAALRQVGLETAKRELRVLGNRVLNSARRRAPVDQGTLRASIALEVTEVGGNLVVARIGSNLDYAIYVHEGTGIYGPRGVPIRPRSGRFMVWPVRNNQYRVTGGNRRYKAGKTQTHAFARQVRGVRARPFLVEALTEVMGSAV